ncbi:VIT1/CCC1 transporter family protein [soil metagenome]
MQPAPPAGEHHHRDISGGTARAAVFGASDGLVSNVSLILGVAAADPSSGIVRLAGLAGLIAGAVSMAAGEYVSMRAQAELFERELDLERRELRRNPNVELAELTQIYQSRGMDPDRAREVATELMADPETALETHAREELGIDPGSLGSPVAAAAWSFGAFALGALVPLLPWFFASGTGATVSSVILGTVAAALLGVGLSRFTGRSAWFTSARQVSIAAVAATITYLVGSAVGVGVT